MYTLFFFVCLAVAQSSLTSVSSSSVSKSSSGRGQTNQLTTASVSQPTVHLNSSASLIHFNFSTTNLVLSTGNLPSGSQVRTNPFNVTASRISSSRISKGSTTVSLPPTTLPSSTTTSNQASFQPTSLSSRVSNVSNTSVSSSVNVSSPTIPGSSTSLLKSNGIGSSSLFTGQTTKQASGSRTVHSTSTLLTLSSSTSLPGILRNTSSSSQHFVPPTSRTTSITLPFGASHTLKSSSSPTVSHSLDFFSTFKDEGDPPHLATITTSIGGSKTLIPVIIGGDLTIPTSLTRPKVTIPPTGTVAHSSKKALETQLSSIFPLITKWTKEITDDTTPEIKELLDETKNKAEDLLTELKDDVVDEDKSKGCTYSLFNILGCVIDDVTDITKKVVDKVTDDLEDEVKHLEKITEVLHNENQKEEKSSSSATSSSKSEESSTSSKSTSSSKSCTSGTAVASDFYITCRPTVISSTTTRICSTATSTVTGCTVENSATTTTLSTSALYCDPSGACAGGCSKYTRPTSVPVCSGCVTISGEPYAKPTTIPIQLRSVSELGLTSRRLIAREDKKEDDDKKEDEDKSLRLLGPADYKAEGDSDERAYEKFFIAQLALEKISIVPHRYDAGQGTSSALGGEFKDRGTMTVQGLYGCTSVIIISRKGVYMSHLFEVPGFKKEIKDPKSPYNGLVMEPGEFESSILYKLWPGDLSKVDVKELKRAFPNLPVGSSTTDNTPWLVPLSSVSQQGGTLDPNQPGGLDIVVVTPGESSQALRYGGSIGRLEEMLFGHYGINARFHRHAYMPGTPGDSVKQTSTSGKILFQYSLKDSVKDAVHKDERTGKSYKCRESQAAYKLWIMDRNTPFVEQDWHPENAHERGDPLNKRDNTTDTDVCIELPGDSSTSTARSTTSMRSTKTSLSTSIKPTSKAVSTSSTRSATRASSSLPAITSCSIATYKIPFVGIFAVSIPPIPYCSCNDHQTASLAPARTLRGSITYECDAKTTQFHITVPQTYIPPTITSSKKQASQTLAASATNSAVNVGPSPFLGCEYQSVGHNALNWTIYGGHWYFNGRYTKIDDFQGMLEPCKGFSGWAPTDQSGPAGTPWTWHAEFRTDDSKGAQDCVKMAIIEEGGSREPNCTQLPASQTSSSPTATSSAVNKGPSPFLICDYKPAGNTFDWTIHAADWYFDGRYTTVDDFGAALKPCKGFAGWKPIDTTGIENGPWKWKATFSADDNQNCVQNAIIMEGGSTKPECTLDKSS